MLAAVVPFLPSVFLTALTSGNLNLRYPFLQIENFLKVWRSKIRQRLFSKFWKVEDDKTLTAQNVQFWNLQILVNLGSSAIP